VGEYNITFARSARKELEALDALLVNRIVRRIDHLSHDPRPRNSIKLRGPENLWRIRVGSYRVIYAIDDSRRVVDITAVRHWRDAYR
jgi:mRNA interferase RelE/StbE